VVGIVVHAAALHCLVFVCRAASFSQRQWPLSTVCELEVGTVTCTALHCIGWHYAAADSLELAITYTCIMLCFVVFFVMHALHYMQINMAYIRYVSYVIPVLLHVLVHDFKSSVPLYNSCIHVVSHSIAKCRYMTMHCAVTVLSHCTYNTVISCTLYACRSDSAWTSC
jgi:hypothetical protein